MAELLRRLLEKTKQVRIAVAAVLATMLVRRDLPPPSTPDADPVETEGSAPPTFQALTEISEAPAKVSTPIKPTPRPRKHPHLSDADFAWRFRSTILDKLDEYFVCMDRLRRHDPDAYALFSRVGFVMSADAYVNPESEANKPIISAPAGLGGILCPWLENEDPDKTMHPSFCYFQRIHHPLRVQPWDGPVYSFTAIFDDRAKATRWRRTGLSVPVSCHIGIAADGTLHVLKELLTSSHSVPMKGKHARGGDRDFRGRRCDAVLKMTVNTWDIPAWVTELGMETPAWKDGNDPTGYAKWLFGCCVGTHSKVLDHVIVRAIRRKVCAAFAVDLSAAKRFFRDRDTTVLAADGRRKRIFHSVRAHDRALSDGRHLQVKQHFRGTRNFDWKGSRIHIVFPKRQEVMRVNGLAANYLEDIPKAKRRNYRDQVELGGIIAKLVES